MSTRTDSNALWSSVESPEAGFVVPRAQLQGLSLALSHSLPGHIDSRRPTVPDWAAPPIAHDIDDKPSQDEPLAKRQELEEDMSYWRQVKATLDEEALALKLERRKAWDAHLKAREQQQSGREGRLV